MEAIFLTEAIRGDRRLVPAKWRARLYQRKKAYWYWALIRYSRRGPAGELRSIRGYLQSWRKVAWPFRLVFRLLIAW